MFDPNDFLNQATDAAMSTQMRPVPEGDYLARIGGEEDSVSAEQVPGRKDPTKTYTRLTLLWEILDENLKAMLERDKITVRDQFLIDLDANGVLKSGPDDNITLGARREALGMNVPGQRFSPAMLRNAGPAMIRVKHRADDRDPTRVYAEVSRVVKMGG